MVALPMVVVEFVDLCQMFPWRLTHKPKHKQRPKPRNRDPNPETKTQTRLAPDQSYWHGTIVVVVMWSSKIPSQMSPWHWFEKRVEDGRGKNGFWPWKNLQLVVMDDINEDILIIFIRSSTHVNFKDFSYFTIWKFRFYVYKSSL